MIRVLTVGDLLPDGFDPKAIAHVRAEVEENFAEGLALAGIEPEVAGDLLEVICNNLPKIGVVLECDVAGARAAGAMVYQEVALVPPIVAEGRKAAVTLGIQTVLVELIAAAEKWRADAEAKTKSFGVWLESGPPDRHFASGELRGYDVTLAALRTFLARSSP